MDQQINRHFIAIISFAVVATWMSAGFLEAFSGLVAALATMYAMPVLTAANQARQAPRRKPAARRRASTRPRRVTTRPPTDEADEYQLVPDDPSLIITVSG